MNIFGHQNFPIISMTLQSIIMIGRNGYHRIGKIQNNVLHKCSDAILQANIFYNRFSTPVK